MNLWTMSKERKLKQARKSNIFPKEHIDSFEIDLDEIYKKQDEELNDVKSKIRKNLDSLNEEGFFFIPNLR